MHLILKSAVAALLAWQAFHAIVLLLTGGYVLARSLTGKLRDDARATIDNAALLWHYVTVQGIAGTLVVHLLPSWL